jgi:hypothetical protein
MNHSGNPAGSRSWQSMHCAKNRHMNRPCLMECWRIVGQQSTGILNAHPVAGQGSGQPLDPAALAVESTSIGDTLPRSVELLNDPRFNILPGQPWCP